MACNRTSFVYNFLKSPIPDLVANISVRMTTSSSLLETLFEEHGLANNSVFILWKSLSSSKKLTPAWADLESSALATVNVVPQILWGTDLKKFVQLLWRRLFRISESIFRNGNYNFTEQSTEQLRCSLILRNLFARVLFNVVEMANGFFLRKWDI
jgi:hypothetical protein